MHDVAKTLREETEMRTRGGGWGYAIGGLAAMIILLVGIKVMQIEEDDVDAVHHAADNCFERCR